jgi:hypothetical protein
MWDDFCTKGCPSSGNGVLQIQNQMLHLSMALNKGVDAKAVFTLLNHAFYLRREGTVSRIWRPHYARILTD